jgi:imidazolonepropionase-like amidohydrolase
LSPGQQGYEELMQQYEGMQEQYEHEVRGLQQEVKELQQQLQQQQQTPAASPAAAPAAQPPPRPQTAPPDASMSAFKLDGAALLPANNAAAAAAGSSTSSSTASSSNSALCRDSFREAHEARRLARLDPKSLGGRERPLLISNVRLITKPSDPTPAPLRCVVVYSGVVVAITADQSAAVAACLDAQKDAPGGGDGPLPPVVLLATPGTHLFAGLMDAHVHCTAVVADLTALRAMPETLLAARSSVVLGEMLRRGFTTVRDAGGADWGLAKAVDEGSVLGPRVLFSGRALSQTGGHGDMRARGGERLESGNCACACAAAGIGRVCDGADAVRKAAREELRLGASFLKMMCSGGVSSPTDSLEHPQFSEAEIRAACEEASAKDCYVAAHAYTPRSILRALAAGVRSIEHGNFLDQPTAQQMASKGAFLVPTLATYWAISGRGEEAGFPRDLVRGAHGVLDAGSASLAVARRAGVRTCFGSDLLGPMHDDQSYEFELRHAAGVTPTELLACATTECAALFRRELDLGRVVVGAKADFCVAAADPREDVRVLSEAERRVACVIKDGLVAKAPTAAWGDAVNGALFFDAREE